MDWLHTLQKEPMLDAVNDVLAVMTMTILDPPRSRTICLEFMDNPFHGYTDDKDEFRRMEARDGTTKCHRHCTTFVIVQGKLLTLAIESVDGEDSKLDTVKRVLARVKTCTFEVDQVLMDRTLLSGS